MVGGLGFVGFGFGECGSGGIRYKASGMPSLRPIYGTRLLGGSCPSSCRSHFCVFFGVGEFALNPLAVWSLVTPLSVGLLRLASSCRLRRGECGTGSNQ